jgi:hypothetical protein
MPIAARVGPKLLKASAVASLPAVEVESVEEFVGMKDVRIPRLTETVSGAG